ncbi:hypothetical protein [Paenibacillus illinoisensis]|uniref:hypothetical protein n=1 Tax=Paenibacillus illinoisensis TaxID=59845 RepID=UPI0030176072
MIRKFRKMDIVLIVAVVAALIVSMGYWIKANKSINKADVEAFIQDQNLDQVLIHQVDKSLYYIFGEDVIYAFKDKQHFSKSGYDHKGDVVFGGLTKGAMGLVINDPEIMKQANLYTLTIDGTTRKYNYGGEKYVVIADERIWNPSPQFQLSFYDAEGTELFHQE